jgi:outer membrane biosynthesis protein TonB
MKSPEQPQLAKKEDARAETMMKDLDAALAKKEAKTQDQPPTSAAVLPLMRSPEEKASPSAIPTASPVKNTVRPEKNAFQPETHRGAVKGTISNVGGEDAVNAAVTPVGRYMRQVTGAIEKKWHQYRLARADAVEPGKMGLRFFVNKNGKVEDLEFTFKESNALMEDFTIEAILKADIPPIPKDLLPILEKERVEINYDIVIHP